MSLIGIERKTSHVKEAEKERKTYVKELRGFYPSYYFREKRKGIWVQRCSILAIAFAKKKREMGLRGFNPSYCFQLALEALNSVV